MKFAMILVVLFAAVPATASDPFLSIDFNSGDGISGPYSPTENSPPQFRGMDVAFDVGTSYITRLWDTDPAVTSGAVLLEIGANGGFDGRIASRDRTNTMVDNGDFTFGDLYRDFVFATSTDPGAFSHNMGIIINGLKPYTIYKVTFYSYDSDLVGLTTSHFSNLSNGWQPLPRIGSITYGAEGLVGNDQYSLTMRCFSGPSGGVFFDETVSGNGIFPVLNGLQIAVPEPTGLVPLVLVFFFRRR